MSFEFLKNEIEHEGQLIKRDDVWKSNKDGRLHRVISINIKSETPIRTDCDVLYEGEMYSNPSWYIEGFTSRFTLIERDGMPWPRETMGYDCEPSNGTTPVLALGRRYWNKRNKRWILLEAYNDGTYNFTNYVCGSHWLKDFDQSKNWWTECAKMKWFMQDNGKAMLISLDRRFYAGHADRIESGSIKLYPSRIEAEAGR